MSQPLGYERQVHSFLVEVHCSAVAEQVRVDIGRDFFVLPSSLHEVLLLPVMDEMSAWDLRQIVGTMNHQVVSDEEVLSDHVYRYLHKCNKLIIAA